jgi:hypothetical protein
MQYTFASILALAASVAAQGVSGVVAPAGSPPAGCSATYASKFEISVVLPMKKRDIVQVCCAETSSPHSSVAED